MSEHHDHLADVSQDDQFEKEMRGYSRRQVDEFVARARSQARELEDRLARSLDDNERLRLELSSARQAADEKPVHTEISERVGQILKLADDEAKAQKRFAAEEIAKLRADAKEETERLRTDAKQETDKFRADAHEQAERMLGAAQEQAENSIASARAEAEKTRTAARTEAERSVSEAHKQAESALASAKAQAKQILDEATARATAIHDGAERRLNLLMSRHSEALRRLTEIRDVVTGLVAGEVARGSLEDEVAKAVANSIAAAEGQQAHAGNGNRLPGAAERHAPVGQGAGPLGPLGQQAGQAQGRALEAELGARTRTQREAVSRPGNSGELRPGDVFRGPGGGQAPGGAAGQAPGGAAGQAPGGAAPGSGRARPGSGQRGRPGSGQRGRPGSGRPGSGRPGSGRPGSGRPGSGRPGSGRPGSGRPGSGRPGSGRPGSGRPGFQWPTSGSRWPAWSQRPGRRGLGGKRITAGVGAARQQPSGRRRGHLRNGSGRSGRQGQARRRVTVRRW